VRDDLSGEDEDEREDLQKREDGTLDGENTGEFEIATVQDIFFLSLTFEFCWVRFDLCF